MPVTVGELAARFGCEFRGDPDTPIVRVGTLSGAGPDAISFLANRNYRKMLPDTRAGAVILAEADADQSPVPVLVSSNPYLLYARIAGYLHPASEFDPGISPHAIVEDGATVATSAWVGPGTVIEKGAVIGERSFVGPSCVVGRDARVGADCRLVANLTLCHGVEIGDRAHIHPGVVIGADGFGIAPDDKGWTKVPQVGSVRIGEDVEIGANTTIDRGAIEDTVIDDGVKLDNQIQVGHNVHIGEHTVVAGCAGISGSTTIGKRCMIAGATGVAGHLTIVDDVVLLAATVVTSSILEPGAYGSSLPQDEARRWRRNIVRFKQLDDMAKRLAKLESWLDDPEGTAEQDYD